MYKRYILHLMPLMVSSIFAASVMADVPHVVSVIPEQYDVDAPISSEISVMFDTDMDEITITNTSFVVTAVLTGRVSGTISYDAPSRTAIFDPDIDFRYGDEIRVSLTKDIRSSDGFPPDYGFVWIFKAQTIGGTCTFGSHMAYHINRSPSDIVPADLDNDGDIDVAITHSRLIYPITADSVLSVMFNNGDGSFAAPIIYQVGLKPWSVCAADFDGDGDIDMATTNTSSEDFSILLNDGNGVFSNVVSYYTEIGSHNISAADFNGDGHIDLAINSYGMEIYTNDGSGVFALHTTLPTPTTGGFDIGDIDNDGDVDIISPVSHDCDFYYNNGNGTFERRMTFYILGWALMDDYDADQDVDLIINGGSTVHIYYNEGAFINPLDYSYHQGCFLYQDAWSGDFDGDGDNDLAVSSEMPFGSDEFCKVNVFTNFGNRNFQPRWQYGSADSGSCICAADFDGDGALDLAVADGGSRELWIFINSEFHCGDGNGDGSIDVADAVYIVNYVFRDGPPPDPMDAGDANCDGNVDIADAVYMLGFIFKDGLPPCCP